MRPSTPKRPCLQVSGGGREHYVAVPHQWAAEIRTYLQRNGLFPGHPQPFDGDTFSIALPPKADARLVQTLLDRWQEAA